MLQAPNPIHFFRFLIVVDSLLTALQETCALVVRHHTTIELLCSCREILGNLFLITSQQLQCSPFFVGYTKWGFQRELLL